MDFINTEINKIINDVNLILNEELLDFNAFNYLTLWYFYESQVREEESPDYNALYDMITDGSNDGGIDYVFYDEDRQKIILTQSKYAHDVDYKTIINEFRNMVNTLENFKKNNTSSYNKKLRSVLRNSLDRFLDDAAIDVEYAFFTISEIDKNEVLRKIDEIENTEELNSDIVSIFNYNDIETQIENLKCEIKAISEDRIKIDKAKNVLHYEADNIKGIIVNVSSNSIKQLYDKYQTKGLFDLNLRRYISNKIVDEGIKRTLDKERKNFWAYNNGLIFACSEFSIDGNKIKLYDFSIVNGGQTTHILGEYSSKSDEEFFIPCKIIQATKGQSEIPDYSVYTRIAETTNSQKPILLRDLKSNSREMMLFKEWLAEKNILLEIKRGVKTANKNKFKYVIKNDELGQLILSFIEQRPGTARSNKKSLFEKEHLYDKVYKKPYHKDSKMKDCIVDLIDLNDRYSRIVANLIKDGKLELDETQVIKNGKCIIFSCLGLFYSILNDDIDSEKLVQNPEAIWEEKFKYSKIISNYNEDDLEEKLRSLILTIVEVISELNKTALEKGRATSVSDYFKLDKTYIHDIVPSLCKKYNRSTMRNDFLEYGKILMRKD